MSAEKFFATLEYLQGLGYDVGSPNEIVVRSMSDVYFQIVQRCSSTADVVSRRDLNCDPGLNFQQNEGCRLCRGIKYGAAEIRQKAMLFLGSDQPDYVDQRFDRTKEPLLPPLDDPCRYVCMSCLSENNKQTNIVRMSVNNEACDWPNVREEFMAKLKEQITESMSAASAIAADLNLVKASNLPQTYVQITQDTLQKYEIVLEKDVHQALLQYQSILFEPGSTSIVASSNVQEISSNVVLDIMSSETLRVGELYNRAALNAHLVEIAQKVESENLIKVFQRAGALVQDAYYYVMDSVYIIVLAVAAVAAIVLAYLVLF
jgi:hypothetical protein